ncbi:hypothetical protein SISSUDRAFT_1129008 [Sistotremastrum suecicum HHB10207 ss-3]|uniref:Arrestin-like N-terminal domain-containing protein n=1 Tax=Sistotremastrum suecicum HHB10207 ss-3 TaxID=1314776 RepID=A0A166D662_9AGAM|nr:hypothetical protein SISSUDRAFT_1129008 [Sistotremastrum suecicum HHB10207 ss-3]
MGNPELDKVDSAPFSDDSDESLPTYEHHVGPVAPHIQLHEQVFDIRDEKTGHPWVTLKVKSLAQSSTSLPVFEPGEDIVGSVELDLKERTTIHSVTLNIRGEVINPQNRVWKDEKQAFVSDSPFLNHVVVLFSQKGENVHGEHGKLEGHHKFPFRFKLPLTADVETSPGVTESFPLPAQFTERRAEASLNYTIACDISYGLIHKLASISKNFGVIPLHRPDPPSLLRQEAYSQGTPPPGPMVDPEGWFTMAPAKIVGKVFHTEHAEITAVLSLAKPLVYTRTTHIPLHLVLTSPSKQALDLVANPEAIQICLTRVVNAGHEARKKTDMKMGPQTQAQAQTMAIFWHSNDREDSGDQDENKRIFEGEIRIKPDQAASSAYWHLVVRYHVCILPFKVSGWEYHGKDWIAEQKVEIVVRLADGPHPVSYAPPGLTEPPLADVKEWGDLSTLWVQVNI